MTLRNLKIGALLKISFAFTFFLVAVLGVTAYLQSDKIHEQTEIIYQHPLQVQQAIGMLRADILSIQRDMKDLFLSSDQKEAENNMLRMRATRDSALTHLSILESRYLGPPSNIDSIKQSFAKWTLIQTESIALLNSGNLGEAARRTNDLGIGGKQAEVILAHMQTVDVFARKKSLELMIGSTNLNNSLNKQLVEMVILILLLFILSHYILLRYIRNPLSALTDAARRFQIGDLEARSSYESKNELGVLSACLNELAEGVKNSLKVSEEKYRNIFENVQDVFFQTNREGIIQEISPSVKDFSEYTREELMGTSLYHLYSNPNDRVSLLKTLMQEGEVRDYAVTFKTKTGRLKYGSMNARLIPDPKGKPHHIDGSVRDITERLLTEEHLKKVYEEIETQNEELTQSSTELLMAKKKAEESDRLKSAFLANMSHEIRTPMNGILGFTELLKSPDLSRDKKQKFLEIIQRSGARMLNIINDIIDISRIESGQVSVTVSEVDVNELMGYLSAFFLPEAAQKGIQLVCNKTLPKEEATILTDRDKVNDTLVNLVKNALKFTSTGTIEFGCEKKGQYLEFFVKDTGAGIPPEKQELIFQRFIQGSESLSRNYEGAGLGLSISKAYVEILGGRIWVESEEGKGSVFYFTIPYDAVSQEPAEEKGTATKNIGELHIKDLKVLIVEDDKGSEMFINEIMKPFAREILTATTGGEAVEACRKNPDTDLILMDIKMPEMDGCEATRLIRRFNRDVVIIAQTAFALSGDKENILKADCNDYISKPINRELLTSLLQKYFS